MKIKDSEFKKLEREFYKLLVMLKKDIGDDYRASDDEETPGMCVTFGVTNKDGELVWNYQTGDNSYTGGAYSHPYWAVISLYRRSNSKELANDAVSQISEAIYQ